MADIDLNASMKKVLIRRWIIFIIMGMAFFFAVAHRVAPVIVADKLMAEFNITSSLFGYLVATYFFIYTIMQIPSGMLADFLGPRKTVTAGVMLAGAGSVLLGLSGSIQFLFISRFLVGLGCSVIFIGILKVVAEWFRVSEFATLSGVTIIIGGMGSIAATYPLAALTEVIGWRTAFISIGIISIVIAILCWLLVRNRPADVGLVSIREIEAAGSGKIKPARDTVVKDSGRNQQVADIGVINALKLTLKNRFTWPPFFAMMLIYGPTTAFIGVISIPYFMQIYGMTRGSAAGILFVMTVGATISGPFVGYLSDKVFVSRKKPYLIFSAVYFCSWLIFILWGGGKPPFNVLYLLLFLISFSSNGVVLTWACAKEVNHPSIAGIASGTVNGGGMLGVALLQPVSGLLLDLGWRGAMQNGAPIYTLDAYKMVFGVFTLAAALGVAAVLLIKETNARNIYHKMIDNYGKQSWGR